MCQALGEVLYILYLIRVSQEPYETHHIIHTSDKLRFQEAKWHARTKSQEMVTGTQVSLTQGAIGLAY